jgi:hypothetical protein
VGRDGPWRPYRKHRAQGCSPGGGWRESRNGSHICAAPAGAAGSACGRAEADLGILVRQSTAPLGDGEPGDLESRASSVAFDACLVGVQERRGTRRPGGTFAEALLAVPPFGADPPAADLDPPTVRPGTPLVEDDPARIRYRPHRN